MRATTIGMPDAPAAPGLDRLTTILLFGFVAAVQLSIAAAQILLGALLLCWVIALIRDKTRPTAPTFFGALLAYAAITLISTVFSIAPLESFIDDRQLLLFLIVPAVYDLARGPRAAMTMDVIITVGAAAAAYGIVQYGMLHFDSLGQRPRGTLGHYMTYSGTLMLVIGAAAARLVFGGRDRTWPALVMPALVVALSLTLTRSAWVGACVAVGVLFILKDLRLLGLLPVVAALLFAFAPDSVTNRMVSMFDLRDPSNRDRLAMARTGTAMVRDFPLTGVGPAMIPKLYVQYRDADAVQPVNPHLHNVPLQIAAERGLPALVIWVAFIVVLAYSLFRLFRTEREPTMAAAALAAIASMLSAGLFEYNFGDSEFLMLFLVLVTLPFAAARRDDAPASPRA
ncbi:MAG TPA: O-antigen ligase family protein [Vicinamibacterales bacterium]|nr:O-antigen ligase family protein [Vicinamibacterales bacterium]